MANYNLVRDINVVGGLFIAPFVLIVLGLFIISKNPYARLNKFFGAYTLTAAVYSFGLGMRAASLKPELALIWTKISSMGSLLMSPLFLLFILVFIRKNKWINNFFTYLITFGSSLIIYIWSSILDLEQVQTKDMYLDQLGRWTAPQPLSYIIAEFWVPILFFIGIFICYRFYKKTKNHSEKKQAALILIATTIPLVLGVFSQIILPRMEVEASLIRIVTFLYSLSPLVMAGSLAYATLKYRLFAFLSPSAVADVIIETMKEALVVTNSKMEIELVNSFTSNLLGYNRGELIGRPISHIFSKEKEDMEVLKKTIIPKVKKGKDVTDIGATLTSREGKKISVSLSSSVLKDEQGKLIGIVTTARDIREVKELIDTLEIRIKARTKELEEERKGLAEKVKARTKELEKERKELAEKMVELERFQKLAVGRELKMIELKKEIQKLKAELGRSEEE